MRDAKMGLTIEEAAEMSGIGRNTMRKLVDWGKLPVLKVGRKTIIRRDALENFMTVNQGRNLLNQADVREVRKRMDTAGKRPRRLRAKYTPRTNLAICTRGISLLRRAWIECSGIPPHIRSREKCSRIFLALLCRPVIGSAAATAFAVAKENERRK